MNRAQAKEHIKNAISCTDYLQKSKGGLFCCPICGSGTHRGSASDGAVKFYPESNTWYCHACNTGGDVLDVYQAQQGTDYNTALMALAERAGITIDGGETRPQSGQKRAGGELPGLEEKAAQIEKQRPADYAEYYRQCRARLRDPAAVSYLQARGISTETAERCGIGFDPAADPAAAPGATTNAGKLHPAPRIIAPCSADFYIARATDPATPPQYKAVNPTGSSAQLFNPTAIYSSETVFITEGLFDALSILEAGGEAIALNSKANGRLLLEQLRKLPAPRASFIICPDNDSNQDTAADTMKRARDLLDGLRGMGYRAIIHNVAGESHDANDALRENRPQFEEALRAAREELQRDELTAFLEKIQTTAYRPHRTGLYFFDDLLGGGIVSQSLLILLAAPGTGKTTLAQQLAETIAKEGRPILYFNFEMAKEQMIAKAISARLHKSGHEKTALDVLQGYRWTEEERAAILRAVDEYRAESWPYIKYNPPGTTSEIGGLLDYLTTTGEKARAAGQAAPAVVVDYLHLLRSAERQEPQEMIKQAVTGLKQYAVDYDTFVIAISATNRTTNKSGRITLESGRDSSNLEYTADYQIALNYTAIDSGRVTPDDVDGIAELQKQRRREMTLRVLKNRFSQPGKSAQIVFDAAHSLFYGVYDGEPEF